MKRPSLLNTASEIDRQFHLADLLATALMIRQSRTFVADAQDQTWSHTVLALAEARSVELVNQSLLLRRYGSRAWGGISLATATMLTLGVLSGNPMITRAGNFPSNPDAAGSVPPSPVTLNENAGQSQIPLENQAESRNASRFDSSQQATDSSTATGDSTHQSNTALDNTGAGIGQTAEAPHQQNLPFGHSDVQSQSASGQTAAGGGNAARNGKGNADTNSTEAKSNTGQHASDWPSNNAAASQNVGNQSARSDSVPDAYRDLVRDYFQRD
jgi:hypothetical protein